MPHIEVIPVKGASAAPGWAYVPDTGFDPSKAAINPSNRKRAARTATALSSTELSARQLTAIQRRITELDKDGVKDPHVAVPLKDKETLIRGKRGKLTTAARRILQSQKTFANHLDDEEALLALGPSKTAAAPAKGPPGPKTGGKARKSLSTAMDGHLLQLEPVEDEVDPLLRTGHLLPQQPPSMELETLLAATPLSYNGSRTLPPSRDAPPQRHFCEICGYWGRIRCMRCGARVCGLDCKVAHDDTRCLKFYA